MTREARSAAWALVVVVPAPTIGALMSFWIAPGPVGLVAYAICKAILYGTPAVWSRFVDGERWSSSRPLPSEARRAWVIALLSGLVIGGSIVLAWWLLGERAIDVPRFQGILAENRIATPARFIAAAAWFSIVNSLLEEYSFRWFITTRIERLTPRGAATLSALAFTAHHVVVLLAYLPPFATALASAGIFVGGLFWSWLYRRCRSVWPGWLSHALVDAAIMAIGYVSLL